MESKNRELIQILILAEVCRELGSSLIFQGGTAIRVFLGGTRTSEDLDFYMATQALPKLDKTIERIANAITQDLGYLERLSLDSCKVQQQDRLYTLWLSFTQGDKRKRTRFKTEFFEVADHFQKIRSQATLLTTAPLIRREISAFTMFLDRLNVVVQMETPEGILADKVVAILARSYVKGRDFWDLWFLTKVLGLSPSKGEIELRREIYGAQEWKRSPVMGGEGWPPKKELIELLDRDLQRFLAHKELESLREEGYERILKSVEDTLKMLESIWERTKRW